MDERVIVDCETGRAVRQALAPGESSYHRHGEAEAEQLKTQRAAEQAARHVLLNKLAAISEMPIGDLERALATFTHGPL